MWLPLALASAVFAALVAVLGKRSLKAVPSSVATAARAWVALLFIAGLTAFSGQLAGIGSLTPSEIGFLVASGLAAGGSWLAYFKALETGSVLQVVAVDRLSLVLTGVLGFTLFGELDSIAIKLAGIALILAGTLLLSGFERPTRGGWLFWAGLSMLLASATSVLAKLGLAHVPSNLGTLIRTCVVAVFASAIALAKQKKIVELIGRSWIWLVSGGLATGASWVCFYAAIQIGPLSAVVAVDKMSVVFAAILAYAMLREKLERRGIMALFLVLAGTLAFVL